MTLEKKKAINLSCKALKITFFPAFITPLINKLCRFSKLLNLTSGVSFPYFLIDRKKVMNIDANLPFDKTHLNLF